MAKVERYVIPTEAAYNKDEPNVRAFWKGRNREQVERLTDEIAILQRKIATLRADIRAIRAEKFERQSYQDYVAHVYERAADEGLPVETIDNFYDRH